MLGTGLKNSLLLLLIILILHFLIKNLLLERQHASKQGAREPYAQDPNGNDGPITTTAMEGKETGFEVGREECGQDKGETIKNDLYKYVMDDGEMEKFFEPNIKQQVPEASEKFDTKYPIACDAMSIMKDTGLPDARKKPKRPEQANNGFLVIHDYSDESALNGGQLYDGLNGYDGIDTMYEEYKCGAV